MNTSGKGNMPAAKRTVQYNTIRARLYPTPEQEALFENTFGCCRYIWNHMLADQERFYCETGTHFIPAPARYKAEAPFLCEVDSQTLVQEYNKLAQAFRSFFRDPTTFRHPVYKRKKQDRDTFCACNRVMGNSSTLYITKDAVRMTKAGLVKASFSRRPRSGWRLTRITVERTRSGRYHAYLLFACPVSAPVSVAPTEQTTLGLKYSQMHFYVADNGTMADPPRWLQDSQDKLIDLQRRLCRMQPGSHNYQRAVQKYRLLHERIANQRRDFLHKESRRIANEWDAVCVRDDSLTAIARQLGGRQAPYIGFGRFREMLRYKLERQGKQLLVVDRFAPTTRTCAACGHVGEELPAKARRWVCPECGAHNQREVNAARNIKAQGLEQVPRAAS